MGIRYFAITVVSLIGIVGVAMLDPIAQDLEYHQFNDERIFLNIPNFWNVITSLPFLIIGISGIYSIVYSHKITLIEEMKAAYLLFFIGISMIAFGSGYYHMSPNNETLVWDRLPMTIAFMALFSIMIAEFISTRIGKLALWPLIVLGIYSIIYWNYTENYGEGDLRLYILVQFLPLLLIPLILLLFRSKFTSTNGYWILLCTYILAKVFEYFDGAVASSLFSLSGHSIKHLIVSLGLYFLLRAYNNRDGNSSLNVL